MRIFIPIFFCYSLFSISGCEQIFRDTEKLIDDVEIVEDDLSKIKKDF